MCQDKLLIKSTMYYKPQQFVQVTPSDFFVKTREDLQLSGKDPQNTFVLKY